MEWRLELFDIRPSLWKLIEEFVPESERPEIKEALGEGLVEETLDLQNEVRFTGSYTEDNAYSAVKASTLLQIWQDYREETDKEEKEQALRRHLNRLPEPPLVRENLKKEITMFVEMLQQRATEGGRDTSSMFNRRDSDLVDYAFDKTVARPYSSSGRPSTAHSSKDGRQTPMRAMPRSEGNGCTPSLSDHLESMNEKLNALEIDRIIDRLRQLLQEEKECLLGDIAFLQDCLMEESDYRSHVMSSRDPEPSLRDLRDLGTKLEKELLNSAAPVVSRQPKQRLSGSRKQLSIEDKVLSHYDPERRVSHGSESHVVPRPPSILNDRRIHSGIVPNRTLVGKYAIASGAARGQFSPSPPTSATQKRLTPSPPSSAKTARPSSATRFRQMVVEFRETGS